MKFVLLLFCTLPLSSAVIHSLRYFYTATSGIPDFPKFVMVGMVDGVKISYYDSFKKKSTPRQTWMEDQLDQEYWNSETVVAMMYENNFQEDIHILQQRFNQTGGIHVLQKMYGCEWDDVSYATSGMDIIGYDAQDFLVYDLENMRWIAPVAQAAPSKQKWDSTELAEQRKEYFHEICVEWLQKYLQVGSSTLGRRVPPEVSLFQKETSSSQVVCHATGFYPEGVVITWKRDGKELEENMEIRETLPNEDGTFQKRALLTVSPEERKTGQYTCEVTHRSGEPVLRTWTEKEGNAIIIISCMVSSSALLAVMIGIVLMKKKGYKKAEQSDTDSDSSRDYYIST